MKTDSSLTVRPLNPDNEVEIQHLVALFERCSDCGILSATVLSPRFWKGAVGRRFSSLIALVDGKIVAHCGFGTEKNSPSMATLTHVMVDSEYAASLDSIIEGFESLISTQMQRKSLTAMIALRHGDGSPAVEEFMRGLHMMPVAQLPDESRGVEVWTRLFDRASRSLQFVPMSLRGTVSAAYRSLGVRSVTRMSSEDQEAISADDLAVEPFPVSRTGRAFLFITPSLLRRDSREGWMPQALEEALSRWPHAFVGVKIADPECATMSQLLQSQGFSYLGILPAFGGWDNILFARTSSDSDARDGAHATSSRIHR